MANKKIDVAVVGGGLAGPIAAAYLAKAGLKTIVFEAHPHLGGPRWTRATFGDGWVTDESYHIPALQPTYNNGMVVYPVFSLQLDCSYHW